ncbi:Probable RNA polymerase sigma factor fecI [Delftia tsuruhatensis]|uniref:sigma-70 family RNA polymerase sigma factor n=1 Tax=Delftia tsuruhatensis TaxID=180282 RepID=UPI001E73DAF7|nr:sigma-70 family RNA polymerase sigma factor [Delftia tsuruhatensis]CAB5716204.1 Probable RNA polymerase sigma factor fecI [Delftia tsuruhatensis]CAC9686107.1 Probable RNA polymerase sigma factor fecI [Delftia tsuruhatensis]
MSRGDISVLYAGHHGWLQRWLQRRLANAGDAADLAQDTFVRLLVAPSSEATALREPRAYLATVARRLLINHLRRQSLEQAWLQALAALPEPQAPSPEQQLLILQALQEVDAMLDGLPPKVRRVFVLSQVEGLTYAAIAEEMGVGLRSVKRYMAQAMAECILLSA